MPQITLTLDLSRETVDALQVLVEALNKKPAGKPALETRGEQLSVLDIPQEAEPEKSAKTTKPPKPVKPIQPTEETTPAPLIEPYIGGVSPITFTDIRAKALTFSQSGKQTELKAIFAKYGAKKLSDISEESFPMLMADMESANG